MLLGNEKLNPKIVSMELKPVFEKYSIRNATLFGSVAKGKNKIDSDVDIVIDSDLKGLAFLGLVEDVREKLNKKVDIFNLSHIIKDSKIDREIKDTGLLIYG